MLGRQYNRLIMMTLQKASSKYVLGLFIDFKSGFDYLLPDSVFQRFFEIGDQIFEERKVYGIGPTQTLSMEVVRVCFHDLLILIEGQSCAALLRRCDEAICIVSDQGVQVGVYVATNKMLFKGRLYHAREPTSSVAENCIRYVTEVRCLAIALQESMCFHDHLDRIREKFITFAGKGQAQFAK